MTGQLVGNVFESSYTRQAWNTFLAITFASIASAPWNEIRAFILQPKRNRLTPKEFFQPDRFLQSAVLGALIPATGIAAGQLVTGVAYRIFNGRVIGEIGKLPMVWVLVLGLLFYLMKSLEKRRQYYDPYAQSRMFRRLRAELTEPGDLSRTGRTGDFTLDDPAFIESDRTQDSQLDAGADSDDGTDDSDSEEVRVPTFGEIARFVAPSFCVVLANSSMTSVDKTFLGRSSTLQLASMGPAASVFDSSSFLLTFLNTATLSLLGMADTDQGKIRQIRSHAIFLATASGLVLGIILFVSAAPLSRGMGASATMLPYSVAYLRIRALGAPIERGTSVATSFCLAAKDSATPLQVTLVGLTANIVLDKLLCPHYGLAGVAWASVFAGTFGYMYLFVALVKSGRWPRPFEWPRRRDDLISFLTFAGPVLFAVFLKTVTLANMTKAACSLGTTTAAAHQLIQTLFLLSAVSLGNPFSWAAQAFLPPLVAAYCKGTNLRKLHNVRRAALRALLQLIGAAVATSLAAGVLIVFFCKNLGHWATKDAAVVSELAKGSWALIPFLALYPVLLTLEGALYGAQERNTVLKLSVVFWLLSSSAIHGLKIFGMLSIRSIWLSIGITCGISTVLTAVFAIRALRTPKCYLFLDDEKS